MANTYVEYTGNNVDTDFAVPFSYIQESYVEVYLDLVLQTQTTHYTFPTAGTLRFVTAPGTDVAILIKRVTPATSPLVTFTNGPRILAKDLNNNAQQGMDIVAEAKDYVDDQLTAATAQAVAAAASAAAAAADAISTAADAVSTAADAATTAADAASTTADAASTAADAIATAADRVQTGLDAAATAADLVATDADTVATAADRVQTGLDVVATAADVTAAAASAAAALTSENNAATSETNAATSEANALAYAARMSGTSTTSRAIGTGSKAFTTQADKFFEVGRWVLFASDAAPATNWMWGQVTAYTGTSITVNFTDTGGSGSHADWTIYVTGYQGPTGPAGADSDMLKATYDPTSVIGDAFAMDNMVEGTTTKIMTDTERSKLTAIEALADVTDVTNVTAALAGATLTGTLDFGGYNSTNLGDLTFKTGASGGTLRTGTSAADKYQLLAYDVDGAAYVLLMEADAGNDPELQLIANYLHLEDATDTTKEVVFTLDGMTTAKTVTLDFNQTDSRTITFPDATGTLAMIDAANQELTGTFYDSVDDDGTLTTGTYTPSLAAGSLSKKIVNGGAFAIGEPAPAGNDDVLIINLLIVNNASAGAITYAAYDKKLGDAFDTTNGSVFDVTLKVWDIGGTHYSVIDVRKVL